MANGGTDTTQAPVAPLNFLALADDDLNGDCYITGAEGEPEVEVPNNFVLIPHGCAVAGDPNPRERQVIANDMANIFLFINCRASLDAARSPQDAARIAYIRFLAVRNGLISPEFTVAGHNVRYNHARQLTQAYTNAAIAEATGAHAAVVALVTHLTEANRRTIRRTFADMVCSVAYMFRVRGHHYRDDFKDRYTTLWARCLHDESERLLDWQYIATDALHAIMPDILDEFWRTCVDESRCAGALVKRFDSAPAGVAGVMALKRGLDDVRMLFPGVTDHVPDSHSAFKDMVTQIESGRWIGSVNSRFYGVRRIRIRESDVGALASVVLGVYTQLASESKLVESPSLQRLAEIAPATGGAIGLAAKRATQSEQFSLLIMGAHQTTQE